MDMLRPIFCVRVVGNTNCARQTVIAVKKNDSLRKSSINAKKNTKLLGKVTD